MAPFDSIICVGQTTWEGDFQKAVVQLMGEFSVRHRVLYVDYQHTYKDLVMGVAGQRGVPILTMMNLASRLVKKPGKNGSEVYVWHPPTMLPINWLPPKIHDRLVEWNVGRLVKSLRNVMQRLGLERPLIINGMNPVFGVPMLNKLNEAGTIYYCFDEITIARWMSRHGGRYEEEYLRRVDAVVTTSETLRRTKSVRQSNTFCVKNGVNFELFNQARQLAEKTPPTTPIVGYLGTADDRINVDIVAHCAQTMPDVVFQFIGEIKEPALTERLSRYPNVVFIPPRQPADLPPLLAQLSAAMIPFVCNEHTYTIYPLKINEYLAAGLPVVSTPFSILGDFDGVIELADTSELFAQALRRALSDHSLPRIMERVEMARANSWEHRAEEFEVVFNKLIAASRLSV